MTEPGHSSVSIGRLTIPNGLARYLKWPKLDWKLLEVVLALVGGLLVGGLIVFANGLESSWKSLLLLIVPGFALVMLINDVKKFLLALCFLAVPINLDISVVLSPYSNKLVALTELRISLVTLVLVVGYALWIIEKPWESQYMRLRFFPSISWSALGIIISMLIAMLQAQDLQLSVFQIVQYVELFLTYFYVANHVRNAEDMSFVFRMILFGLLFESVIMILQWTIGFEFSFAGMDASVYGAIFEDMQSRVSGTLDGPNGAGAYLSAHLALATAFIFAARTNWEKWLGVICLGTGGIALVGTFSRSAWAGLVAAILMIVGVSLWRGWIKLSQLVGVLVAFVIMIGALYGPIVERLTGDDHGSADSRTELASLAWEIIRAKPITGIGTNNYAVVAGDYISARQNNMDLNLLRRQPVHNMYLLMWAERGLIGLVAFAVFFIIVVFQVIQCALTAGRFSSLMALGLLGAFLTVLVRMYGQHGVGRTVNLYFWLFIALSASLTMMPTQTVEEVL